MRKQISICALFSFFLFLSLEGNAQNPVSAIRLYKESLHQFTDSFNVVHYPDSAGSWYRLVVSLELADSLNPDSVAIDSLILTIKNLDSATTIIGTANFNYHNPGQFLNNTSYLRDQHMLYFTLGDFVLTMPVFVETFVTSLAPATSITYTANE